ncbi:hypothetical protein [Pantoea sp. ICBG 1758]|uniref:hypothetical protein n=1 Tax=Pantoea sp. ICBG 1758 TaxID=2071682 RepID=UPI001304CDF4|nr:hypothetical protein [Pantoea sp. ICBG 1758]
MNEQQVSELLQAMSAQTKAISRLADSNEALAAVMYQVFSEEIDQASSEMPAPSYLNGKARG